MLPSVREMTALGKNDSLSFGQWSYIFWSVPTMCGVLVCLLVGLSGGQAKGAEVSAAQGAKPDIKVPLHVVYHRRHQPGWSGRRHKLVYGRQFVTDWQRYKQREAQRLEEKRKAAAVAAAIVARQNDRKKTATVLPDVINAVHSDAISDEVLTRKRYNPPSVKDQHFFGDWGGIQPWLVDHGISLLVSLNEELAGNLTGGKKRANSNAGQVGLELDIDWQKLAGLRNFKTHTIIVNGHGRSVSTEFGDTLAASQEIYGARGNVVAHLVAMYGERSFWKERVNLNVGWMPVGSFFAASPLFCDFMNVAICGNPGPNKYTNGNRDWPSGNLGMVVHVMPIRGFYVMGGLFAVSPHGYNGGISGWSWAQDGLGKFSTPVELGWLPEFGRHHLTGHYKLGYSYDNSRYPDLYHDAYGQPFLLTGRPQRYRAGMNSAWFMADQMLLRHGPGESNGLILLGGAMYTDGKTVSVHEHEWLGLLETGRLWNRPLDTVGVMWQHLGISSSATHQQEASVLLGRPFLPNRWGAVDGVQSHENVYELFYSAHVARAMALQPDFQYIQRPSATTAYHDAAVFGLQFTVVL